MYLYTITLIREAIYFVTRQMAPLQNMELFKNRVDRALKHKALERLNSIHLFQQYKILEISKNSILL